MAKNSKDAVPNKSLFLLTSFLGSEKRYQPFDVFLMIQKKGSDIPVKTKITEYITSYDIAILLVIGRYCDMRLGYCLLKQPELAKECGMGITKLKDRLRVLEAGGFILCSPKGKLNRYQYFTKFTGEEIEDPIISHLRLVNE